MLGPGSAVPPLVEDDRRYRVVRTRYPVHDRESFDLSNELVYPASERLRDRADELLALDNHASDDRADTQLALEAWPAPCELERDRTLLDLEDAWPRSASTSSVHSESDACDATARSSSTSRSSNLQSAPHTSAPKRSLALEAALRSAEATREAVVDREVDASGTIDPRARLLDRDEVFVGDKPPAIPLTPTVKRRRPTKPPIESPLVPDATIESRFSEADACESSYLAPESEVARDPILPFTIGLADTDRFERALAAPGGGDGDDDDEDLPFDLDLDAEDELRIEELGDGGADDVVHSGRLDVDLRASTPVSRRDATLLQRTGEMFSRTVRRVMVPLLAIVLLVIAMGGRWSFAGSAPSTQTYVATHTGSAAGAGSGSSSAAVPHIKFGHRELSGKININTASEDELQLLPTVGPSKAERIVTWRKKNGGFKRAADLRRVKGFGYKTYKKLEPFLDIKGDTTLAAVK
ncbi:MAG: helix-hairpin-helix domain-containing protein [Kofleriaceae bacterium]